MMTDFSIIMAVVIGFSVIMYVILDGFDLGVGILCPFFKSHKDRDRAINSIAPFWDGNETWLILGGITLFAAFPKAYAALLPVLYLPLLLFLVGLILRGAAFEFRYKETKRKYIWDFSFSFGSALAAFMQGYMVGIFVTGLPSETILDNQNFSMFFSIFTGIAFLYGYALLGATWLIIKTEGELQEWSRQKALIALPVVFAFIVMLSIWTSISYPNVSQRWFSWPNIIYLSPIPFYLAIGGGIIYFSLKRKSVYLPFIATVFLYLIAFLGVLISFWPYIVPWRMTIWDAASPPESQAFIMTGIVLLLPVVIFYTIHAYWVFRGKANDDIHY